MKPRRLGHTLSALVAVAAITFSLAVRAQAQTETVLLSFTGMNGEQPFSAMIFDKAGNLYGTTSAGGDISDTSCTGASSTGCGTVFELSRNHTGAWKETVLHQFSDSRMGLFPETGLVQDATGNLYGTAEFGGLANSVCSGGCGVAYELSPPTTTGGQWRETVLYIFKGSTDGGLPSSGLIFDAAGNLYGTAQIAGNSSDCPGNVYPGCGVAYELSPMTGGGWKETVLYSFTGGSDGGFPGGNLVIDSAGNLYGAASYYGGSSKGGTIFELSPSASGGWTETTIYTFAGAPDGSDPDGNLIFDASGNLYGMTYHGGNGGGIGSGTVFELSPSSGTWTETILFDFNGGTLGGNPLGGIIFDDAGNLYGTTSFGGPSKHMYGLVFELSPQTGTWKETVLHNFSSQNGDGEYPLGGLVFDKVGNLYGMTNLGGTAKQGTIFEIAP